MNDFHNILSGGQISRKYDGLSTEKKLSVLEKAFEIKENNPGKSNIECIANALGYELSISGSTFYTKVQS